MFIVLFLCSFIYSFFELESTLSITFTFEVNNKSVFKFSYYVGILILFEVTFPQKSLRFFLYKRIKFRSFLSTSRFTCVDFNCHNF